jgi:LytS/YehU family sensor histidine kinase
LHKNALLQRERLKGQFETLRNQINPHFLFNSFNTLISTIAKDKDQAIDYVEQLSDYFRIILEQREKEVITLKEELELADRYLFLQKQRFGDNLVVIRTIPDDLLDSLIPPMTIQLLVENAIKHNIISRLKPLTIELYVSDKFLVVSNTLQEKTQKEPSTGVGLNNIVHRYLILFKKEVLVVKNENRFEVLLPLNQPSD